MSPASEGITSAWPPEFFACRFKCGLISAGDGDPGAFVQELACGFEANAAGPASNESALALEPVHDVFPLVLRLPVNLSSLRLAGLAKDANLSQETVGKTVTSPFASGQSPPSGRRESV